MTEHLAFYKNNMKGNGYDSAEIMIKGLEVVCLKVEFILYKMVSDKDQFSFFSLLLYFSLTQAHTHTY